MRDYNFIDRLLAQVGQGLRTALATPNVQSAPSPADRINSKTELNHADKRLSAQLMRVNHAGEIAAQGLYHGHACTARDQIIKQKMRASAAEEQAHLSWCEQRLAELGHRPSVLNPLWYVGSYAIGAATGALGDKWSLGFISETERQVVQHLDRHLARLPKRDEKSRAILSKMREDEARHDKAAQDAGAHELPKPARLLMGAASKVMTNTAYWL